MLCHCIIMLIFLSILFYFMKMGALLHICLHHLCFWCPGNRRGFRFSWGWGCRQLWAVTWILGIDLCPPDEPLVFLSTEPSLSPLSQHFKYVKMNNPRHIRIHTHSLFVFCHEDSFFFKHVGPFSTFSHEHYNF